MRVAVIIDTWFPFIGGGQINAWEIAKRLARKRVKIDIITRDNGVDNLERVKNLRVYKLGPKSNYDNYISKIIFIVKSYFFLANKNYDIVHAYAFLPAFTAKLLMMFNKKKAVLSIFGTSIGSDLSGFFRKIIENTILLKIKYSAQITDSRNFLKLKNVNPKIIYIPHGVSVSQYDKVLTTKFRRTTILIVARLHPQKNLLNLIKAISIVIEKLPQTQLLIVGDGQQKYEIKSYIKRLKLTKNVHMLGIISGMRLVKIYTSCHLFILPSLYEGQPISLLDAWAARLPVIVAKTGDCQYLVKNGINGYLIANQNEPNNIAQSIINALNNKDLEKLGQNGYHFVKKNFSWEKSAQQTLDIYEKITKSKN